MHDKIDKALGNYILMKIFDNFSDPMPDGIKKLYKSSLGYNFWIDNFKDDKTVKLELFKKMLNLSNSNSINNI